MVIITAVHDPLALAETCRQCNLMTPKKGTIQLGEREVFGWIVHLPGLQFPVVVNTLTGLISYHPRDNAFRPYLSIMHFIHRFYAVRHKMRQGDKRSVSREAVYRLPRPRSFYRRRLTA